MTTSDTPPRCSPTRDPAPFVRAYEEHGEALYRFCRSILRDEHDAHDALSSAITKAFSAWQHGTEVEQLRPWLFRIAHNEAISLLRRRDVVRPTDEPPELPSESLELTVERRERLAHLQRDIDALPELQRAALVLRELNGLGHEEIAAVLDSTPRAIKQTIYEARVGLLDAEAGRGMSCDEIQKLVSDGDGRVLRGRRVRGHVRSCPSCRRFAAALNGRPADLGLLAPPLAPVAATAILANALAASGTAGVVLGGSSAAGAGGAALTNAALATSGATAGGAAAAAAPGLALGTAVATKGAVAVALAATAVGGGVAVERAQRDAPPPAPTRAAPASSRPAVRPAPATRPGAAGPTVRPAAPGAAAGAAGSRPARAGRGTTTAPARVPAGGTTPRSSSTGQGKAKRAAAAGSSPTPVAPRGEPVRGRSASAGRPAKPGAVVTAPRAGPKATPAKPTTSKAPTKGAPPAARREPAPAAEAPAPAVTAPAGRPAKAAERAPRGTAAPSPNGG